MATAAEIEKQIADTQAIIDQIENAEATAGGSFVYRGKSYTQAQLVTLSKPYKTRLNSLKKIYAPYKAANDEITRANAALVRAKEIAANPTVESPTGISKSAANKAVKDAESSLAKANSSLTTVTSSLGNAVIPEEITAPVVSTGGTLTRAQSEAAGRGRAGVTGGFGANKVAPKKEKFSTDKTGGGGPAKPGTVQGDTTVKGGVNYTWNGTNWIKSGAVPFDRVESTFRKMFPSQAWLLDLDRTKYPKLFELIQRGVSGRMYETQQGLERFAAELKNTDFYTELATTDKVRQIKAVTGDLGFEGSNFNKFLTTSMNMGWEGETLKAETYKEVFRKDDAGNYLNTTAVQRAKKSNEYLKVANVGKAFFNTISDSTIESRLTGALNDDDIQRQQRELAKSKYAHLGNLIDQGFTLADLSSGFKQQAASLLEKDENAIDMSQADFEAAYNYGEPGQKRMMTNGEWEIMLRSNAKFGWDKTNNAKAEARQLASSISQAFGRII
jgi:hypothetical protein